MAAYANLHAGVGKPLWEITLGEFTIWFQVSLLPRQLISGLEYADNQ